MLGLINDCTEQLVISNFGLDAWHEIKKRAGCDVRDYGFVRHDFYPDSATIDVVVAAADVLGVSVDAVLETFGAYFMEYTRKNGYANLLACQGSNLRLWLSNLNALHDHLHSSMPKEALFPTFWCEDEDDDDADTCCGSGIDDDSARCGCRLEPELDPAGHSDEGSRGSSAILLHYFSHRGSLLAPIVVGIVREAAAFYFDVEIEMERIATQGEDGSEVTSWRVTAKNLEESWKLSGGGERDREGAPVELTTPSFSRQESSLSRQDTLPRRNSADLCSHVTPQRRNSNEPFGPRGGTSGGIPAEKCPFSGAEIDPAAALRDMRDASSRSASTVDEERRPERSGSRRSSTSSSTRSSKGRFAGLRRRFSVYMRLNPTRRAKKQKQKKRKQKKLLRRSDTNRLPETSDVSLCSANSSGAAPAHEHLLQLPPPPPDSAQSSPYMEDPRLPAHQGLGFTAEQIKSIFPYHVVVDSEFRIVSVGKALPKLLAAGIPQDGDGQSLQDVAGRHVGDVLRITKPVLGRWDWSILHKLADQTFCLVPAAMSNEQRMVGVGGVRMEKSPVQFKGNMIKLARSDGAGGGGGGGGGMVMFVLSPRAKNISELSDMGLTMSDLPLHTFQRDAIFLGEHIASEVRTAQKLDRLSKRLENEKNLSNTLLYNMLPRSVADELRSGRTVEPAHYENVTLFFSDVVGFTSICDRIEPWDVIDMLNQLYSVMDYLASKFNLYKVETIGDAYMCCSGLPFPDELHAENVANFAIAVMECVRHVRSPADGTPIQLRIGIHTGHCMGGVVGMLTPHYCLFGDMVNTTARHESTGLAGKIQCSSVLYGRLKHFSSLPAEQYEFSHRGLVAMKGKGEAYTYWLDGGTEHNATASPESIRKLYGEVGEMLAKKKWKKRRYFRRSSMFGEGSVTGSDGVTVLDSTGGSSIAASEVGSMTNGTEEEQEQGEDTASCSNAGASEAGSSTEERERTLAELDEMIDEALTPSVHDYDAAEDEPSVVRGGENIRGTDVSTREEGRREMWSDFPPDYTWADVGWNADLTHEDLISSIHGLMLTLLKRCLVNDAESEVLPENWTSLDTQLYGFVRRISTLYRSEIWFHNWRHACHVVLGATFLMERMQEGGDDVGLTSDPWIRFAAAFAALIHDAKHLGVPNRQLETEHNVLCEVYVESTQEWQSVHTGVSIFTVGFPELSREVLRGCPTFIHLVTSAVLATDIASSEVQQKTKEKFERSIAAAPPDNEAGGGGTADSRGDERMEAALEQIILLADVGHCSQKYETFLRWNRAFYMECLVNHLARRGDDPRNGWYEGQIGFLQHYILPLAERCEGLMRQSCGLKEGVESILNRWKREGGAWTDRMIEELSPDKDGNVIALQRRRALCK